MLIKSADDKSSRLRFLEELKNKPLTSWQREKLDEDLKKLRTGIEGEREAAYHINACYRDSDFHAVLHDLRIEVDGESAQIDHLVVSNLFVFILETKNFSGNVSINEYGEFSVKYARELGVASPIEQGKKQARILLKLLKKLDIKGINDKPLEAHYVVLLPNSKIIIDRPDAREFDTFNVIKADQLSQWRTEFAKRELGLMRILSVFRDSLLKPQILFRSGDQNMKNRVRDAAKKIAAQHRRPNPHELPAYISHELVASPTDIEDRERPAVTAAACLEIQAISSLDKPPPCCEYKDCGRRLTEAVINYCRSNAAWFGGKLYCMQHQKVITTARKKRSSDRKNS